MVIDDSSVDLMELDARRKKDKKRKKGTAEPKAGTRTRKKEAG